MPARAQLGTASVSGERTLARWARTVVVLGIGLVVCAPALFVLAWFTFAGGRFGWIPSLLACTLLGFVSGWAAVPRHWRMARKVTSIALAVIAGFIGVAAAHFAPASPGRLRHEIQRLAQPGWRLEDDTADGSAACFDFCTSVTREYRIEADVRDVLSDLRPVLARRRCFQTTPGVDPDRWACGNQGSDVDVRVEFVHERDGVTVVSISARATG